MPRYGEADQPVPAQARIDGRVRRPGRPVRVAGRASRSRRPLQAATAAIMTAITALLEDLRGETAPAGALGPGRKHGQTETGTVLMARRVAVLGAGSWGTTFAKVLADGGNDVALWARRPSCSRGSTGGTATTTTCPGMQPARDHPVGSDLDAVLAGAEQVFLSVPSQSLRGEPRGRRGAVCRPTPDRRQPDEGRREGHRPPDERGASARGSGMTGRADRGGLRARTSRLEIAREQPTAAVVASTACRRRRRPSRWPRPTRTSGTFVNTDVIGTEFGGVLKNLIAVAIGIVDRRRLRREHEGVDHHPRPGRDDGLRGRVRRAARDPRRPRRASATSSPPASRRCRATTRAGRLLGQGYSVDDVIRRWTRRRRASRRCSRCSTSRPAAGVDDADRAARSPRCSPARSHPRDIAPHSDEAADPMPAGRVARRPVRSSGDGFPDARRARVRRPLQRARDQLRDRGRRARRDRPGPLRRHPVGITHDGAFVLERDDPAALRARPRGDARGARQRHARALAGVDDDPRAHGAGARTASVSSLGDVDVVFPILHGPFGEDGTIQGLLRARRAALRRQRRARVRPRDGQALHEDRARGRRRAGRAVGHR